jgi:hypothetical protein
MGDTAVPVALDDGVEALLFPKLLVILIPIVMNKLFRSPNLFGLNNAIQPTLILNRPSENILFQRLGIGNLLLLLGERIQSLYLDFGLVNNIINAILTVLSVRLGIAHVFEG